MKIISIFVAFCFTMNVFASTGSFQEIERAIDDYQFAMTVEWDQKDKEFQTAKTQAFAAKMGELFKSGLAVQDVNFLLETRFKNSKALEALKLKVQVLEKTTSPEEIAKLIQEHSSELYSSGASWNGNAQLWTWGIVIVAIAVVSMAYEKWQKDNYECVKYAEADQCTDEYDCAGDTCWYDGSYCKVITRCIKEVRK